MARRGRRMSRSEKEWLTRHDTERNTREKRLLVELFAKARRQGHPRLAEYELIFQHLVKKENQLHRQAAELLATYRRHQLWQLAAELEAIVRRVGPATWTKDEGGD
jgi:hypothetical protein